MENNDGNNLAQLTDGLAKAKLEAQMPSIEPEPKSYHPASEITIVALDTNGDAIKLNDGTKDAPGVIISRDHSSNNSGISMNTQF